MDTVDTTSSSRFERIQSLDILRGIALCGILVMNITSFGLPGTAYSNPTSYGGELFINHLIFAFTHIFFDQKMMGLFSLLFGASVMLFCEKLQLNGRNVPLYYYSRTLWLIAFGVLHGIFLWEGDILFFYGLCGLALFFFRRAPPIVNFVLGLSLFLVAIGFGEYGQHWLNQMTDQQIEYYSWSWQPQPREIEYEIGLRMETYHELMGYRWETSELNLGYSLTKVTRIFLAQGLSRAFGLMLVGMAFYRWNIFRSDGSKRLGVVLLIAASAIIMVGLRQHYQHHWDIRYSMFHGHIYNHVATPLMVMAYVFLLLYALRSTKQSLWARLFANYGRMAFSNYLMQSLVCTTLFYGYGFGVFAQFNRLQLMFIVAVVIAFQFLFSNLWLRYFQYGPLEWVWRTCTFFRFPSKISGND